MEFLQYERDILYPSTLNGKDCGRVCYFFETRELLDNKWTEFIFQPNVVSVEVSRRRVKTVDKEYTFICAVDSFRLKGCIFESYVIFKE